MLMVTSPLTTSLSVNFNNILRAVYFAQRSQKRKKTVMTWLSFCTDGIIGTKSACKMLVKSTPGVNFTNILKAAFAYKSIFEAFLYLQFGFVIFVGKRILAQKLLVKCWWNWHRVTHTIFVDEIYVVYGRRKKLQQPGFNLRFYISLFSKTIFVTIPCDS